MKLKLYVTVAHPHLPGEAAAPEIFVSVHATEEQAMQDGLHALTVLQERLQSTKLHYAIETVAVPLELHPGWAIASWLLRTLAEVGRCCRSAAAARTGAPRPSPHSPPHPASAQYTETGEGCQHK